MKKNEIRNLQDGNWYWIEKEILLSYGRELKASGIAIYNVLALFANSQTQRSSPSQKTLAQLTGLSKRTVIRKLNLLERLGLIKKIKIHKRRQGYLLLKATPPKVPNLSALW